MTICKETTLNRLTLLVATAVVIQRLGFAAGNAPVCDAPIGVFDSGLGGLTVLERLLDVDSVDNASGRYGPDGVPDLVNESFVYFGDQANMPYGDYAAEGKSDFLRELILDDASFLLGTNFFQTVEAPVPDGTKRRAKIIVIACNTATAWGLSDIRRRLASEGDATKVVGVIEAGVRAALDIAGAGTASKPFALGVLATPGTIASGAYERTIRTELASRSVTCEVPVVNQGCAGLADAVEAGSPDAGRIAASNLTALVERHAASGAKIPLKAVILGCTHYPFVLDALERTARELRGRGAPLASDLRFVDPAFYTAAECHKILKNDGLLVSVPQRGKSMVFMSVPNPALPAGCLTADGQLARAFKYGRNAGYGSGATRPVPFTRERFGDAVFRNIARLLPHTAALLSAGEDAAGNAKREASGKTGRNSGTKPE
ncbi:MAG: aspartate/glutamate racemase family protein [Kiritimatiellae bacterium]|nr:aspartate/glutamate racemase family protein [Kiritimatiellia bacterium]